ncbi:hypothetical protein [Pseudoxanthomonas wuyuanensis]|uniref:Uncharacterized protein n=1 Tax=Pseudoxanthomonas wuyuanensis TaxID=1073196 RepID=A0A286D9S6_9GAMM|nr:hypothetical protein [Pseudoxanthomonas wuyuanensis]KAF1719479.1 hypothetical protein CSC75_15000 [Pseudoxanthomonas wuyuanensis]SOD55415.1 hypothetical protein SAMN06296416_10793 [Pseudoxanthomonas wuyuanensis]
MNTKTLLPLTAAAVFALCAGSMVISATHADNQHVANQSVAAAPSADRIVTLPTVSVQPAAEDLAHYQAYRNAKIVDLATVTVRPAAEDLAAYLANQAVRIVDMPVVTVRPSAEDMRAFAIQAGALAGQLASR